ncbi:cysteine-rich receptor-like protein kinase, partial [Tanacetum coccineum]
TMARVDVYTLTMEQYLALSRENQAPGVNKDEDAHDHIDWVLSIIGLFNIPEVSKDAVMLQVFLFTLTESAKRWVDRLAPGTINTWDLLKKAFIQRYFPPSMTTKQLEYIHNIKQEGDESLYQAWERYNDLLYKCPTHDINNHQKTTADHSKKWHDGTTSKNIGRNTSKDGLAALVNKLDNLGRDMKKLKESIHAI